MEILCVGCLSSVGNGRFGVGSDFLFPSFSLEHGYVNSRGLYSDCFWNCILSSWVLLAFIFVFHVLFYAPL